MQTIHEQIAIEILDYLEAFKDNYVEQRFQFEFYMGTCDNSRCSLCVFQGAFGLPFCVLENADMVSYSLGEK